MNVTIQKSQLHRILTLVQNVVEKKTTMPILNNLLLTASNNQLRIAGSDLEISSVATSPADVIDPGRTTINAKIFSEIVRELPDGLVTLRVGDGERIEITTHNSRLTVVGNSAEEYPALPAMDVPVLSSFPGDDLLEMIQKTLYAVSTDESRYSLNGVCFQSIEEGGINLLRLAATDGHRLALATRPAPELSFPGRLIVPRKGLSELRKVLGEGEGTRVGLNLSEGFLVLETGECKISMRLIDGEFPDYNQVIPAGKGETAVVSTQHLVQALKRVSLLVTDKNKCVRLDFSEGRLSISSSSPELGEGLEELEIEYSGQPLNVGFNARYLLDIAAAYGEQQNLLIELHGQLGPGKFMGGDDASALSVVMPMRL